MDSFSATSLIEGYTPREIQEQIRRKFPQAGESRIMKLFRFLATIAPYLIPLFMADANAEVHNFTATPPGDYLHGALTPEPGDVEADLVAALDARQNAKIEPGKMGGPVTEAAVKRAFLALLDLARTKADDAAAIVDRVLNRFLPFPTP